MTIRTFIVTLYTTYPPGGVGLDKNLAETIKAGLYKTYANPTREDEGITMVEAVPAVVQSDNPRTWRAAKT